MMAPQHSVTEVPGPGKTAPAEEGKPALPKCLITKVEDPDVEIEEPLKKKKKKKDKDFDRAMSQDIPTLADPGDGVQPSTSTAATVLATVTSGVPGEAPEAPPKKKRKRKARKTML